MGCSGISNAEMSGLCPLQTLLYIYRIKSYELCLQTRKCFTEFYFRRMAFLVVTVPFRPHYMQQLLSNSIS